MIYSVCKRLVKREFSPGYSRFHQGLTSLIATLSQLRLCWNGVIGIRRISAIFIIFGFSITQSVYAQWQELKLSPEAQQQLQTLTEEKQSRTPAQKKISPQLLFESKRRKGDSLFQKVPELHTGIQVRQDSQVEVDIHATVSKDLLSRIEILGGRVVNKHPRFDAIRAWIPVKKVELLAAHFDVKHILPAARPVLRMINTSEGDVAHQADIARSNFGVDGSGVKVCAISDSVDQLTNLQASGDLPPGVDVLSGQSGNGMGFSSEGTALLEIIFDLAPGASLGYATGFGGIAQMAQNILDLEAASCDVIVDDVGYIGTSIFQDDPIAQAVDEVAQKGVLYFSAAGNSGNLNDGTSGVWEGDYSPGSPSGVDGVGGRNYQSDHDWTGGGGSGTNINQITADSSSLTLQWNDPWGQSGNDYDLFLINPALTTIVGISNFVQDGDDLPSEGLNTSGLDVTNHFLLVALESGAGNSDDRVINVNTHRGRLNMGTEGQIFGHPAAVGALAVAAVDISAAGGAGGVFNGSESVETFSSDGPRRIFFDADGNPVGFAAAGLDGPVANGLPLGLIREKPDIAAADGVMTATDGTIGGTDPPVNVFNPFFGTSAAAPHAAAIAALMCDYLSSCPSYQGVRYSLKSTTIDIEAPGFDRDSGFGIWDANNAVGDLIFTDGFESGNTSAWQ